MKELNQKLAQIQTELKVKKSSYNSFGKYYFRKAEDILEAVKPFLLKHNVSVTIDEDILATDPVPMLKSTAIISDGENQISTTAIVGVDLNQKGMQAAQSKAVSKIKEAAKPAITQDQLSKAKEYVAAGGTVDAIENKYKLTNEQRTNLTKTL